MRQTTHRLGNALRACAAAAVLALFSGCGDVPADEDEADDITTKVSALDPCQQCETRYTNCMTLANQRLRGCLNTCSNATICYLDYNDSARACSNQREICVNNYC